MPTPPWVQLGTTALWVLLGLTALLFGWWSLRRRRAEASIPASAPGSEPLSWLQVEAEHGTRLVRTADIDWIEAAGNHVRVHHAGAGHLFRASLSRLEDALDSRRFVRIHRSTIVNLGSLSEVHPWGSGDSLVRLRDGTELRLSRTYAAPFEERVARRM